MSGSPPTTGSSRHMPAARASVWPTVIGVIAIVFGVLGALGGCGGLVFLPLIDWMAANMPPDAAAGFAGMVQYRAALLAMYAVMLGLGVLLTWGGVELSRRRARGAKLILWWAWGKIVFAIASAPVVAMMQISQFEAVEETSGESLPFASDIVVWTSVAAAAIGALWYCVLPVFMLIWFGRGKIRGEVARWAADRDASA